MPSEHTEKLADTQLRVLQAQLERMRGMHYGYYVQFFQASHLFTVLTLLNLAVSLYHPLRAAILVLPFFIVYAGFFCAYLLTYNLFARIYATALEKKINGLLGGEFLVAHKMEEAYIYRTPGPKFVALDLGQPYTFIGASTISFTVGGVLTYILAAYRAWQLLPDLAGRYAPLHFYWPLLAVWTIGHLIYLVWFYVGGKPERTIAAIVNDAYGTSV
jgi:hypothetical protein